MRSWSSRLVLIAVLLWASPLAAQSRIDQLSAAAALSSTDSVPICQGCNSSTNMLAATLSQWLTYLNANLSLAGSIITSGTVAAARLSANIKTTNIEFVIDGGGAAIATGKSGDLIIDYACTISKATLLADQTGSIVVDIWKLTYSVNTPPTVANTITASALPTLSSAQSERDTTLTGWTTSVSAGDQLRFNVNSATTVTRVTLALECDKT